MGDAAVHNVITRASVADGLVNHPTKSGRVGFNETMVLTVGDRLNRSKDVIG